MNNKFSFSPGLPGYGTQGTDGSAGLQGLGFTFSIYNGLTDSVVINSRIFNNQDLLSSGNPLPDGRIYQEGDLFIDTNGRVFRIDPNGGLTYNRYEDTGEKIGGTSEFEEGVSTITSGFTRFYNDYSGEKKIYDDVYTNNSVADYTSIPSTLYIDNLKDFGKIYYSDLAINSYIPFQAWTSGSSDENAIGLVREQASNTWHFGNLDDSDAQRPIDLALDFEEIKLGSYAGVTSNNFYSLVDISSYQDFYFTGEVNNHYIKVADSSINTEGNLYIQSKSSLSTSLTGGDINIYSGDGHSYDPGPFNIVDSDGGAISLLAGHGGNNLNTGNSISHSVSKGGVISIRAGEGGNGGGDGGEGGQGGEVFIFSGNGGNGIAIAPDTSLNTVQENRVQGNIIGANLNLSPLGGDELPNDLDGIAIFNSNNNLIGGTTTGTGNLIVGNEGGGISVGGGLGANNLIQNNTIRSHDRAVVIRGGASNNSVGAAGVGNAILDNNRGVVITDLSVGNRILNNTLFNPVIDIDLGGDGITANDLLDGDTGPNNLQNTPILQTAIIGSTNLNPQQNIQVTGILNSTPNGVFTIQLFANVFSVAGNPDSLNDQVFLGEIQVVTDENGNGAFSPLLPIPEGLQVSNQIIATATDGTGSTSEFSPAIDLVPQNIVLP
ncbi:MAG: hypothetical protein HC831_22590, partial [Chloroflexia bacterium]|nr:hypothetical protein [Chloroflexia bacterium]